MRTLTRQDGAAAIAVALVGACTRRRRLDAPGRARGMERGKWVVPRCHWLMEGRASGAATAVAFTFLILPRDGRIAVIRAFFEHDEALRALT